MLANILILLFLIGMAYWWAIQGFFSAFIHLCLTITAAAIAISFWEPLVLKFLIFRMPYYAWAVGLLGPFSLVLILLRGATDRLIPGNVHFQLIIGRVFGGLCGFGSAILTAGLVVIGLGFLPLGPTAIGGYQPYGLNNGRIMETGQDLWIGVDTMAEGFLAGLAGGSFYPWGGTPMAIYQPGLAAAASQIRLRDDENGSIVAVPGAVTVSQVVYPDADAIVGLPDSIKLKLSLVDLANAQKQLVVVDTIWRKDLPYRGTYDQDQTARIPPSQVRLVTSRRVSSRRKHLYKHTPVAVCKQFPEQRQLYSFVEGEPVVVYSLANNDKLAWVFLIGVEEELKYLNVRHLRLSLSDPMTWKSHLDDLAPILGQLPEIAQPAATIDGSSSSRATNEQDLDLPQNIQLTNKLTRPFSRNGASSLSYDQNSVTRGCSRIKKSAGRLSQRNRIDSVYCSSHLGMVRMELPRDEAQSLLGRSRSQAKSLGGIYLVDDRGEPHRPIGYNWLPKAGQQKLCIDPDQPIRSAQQLPIREMEKGDQLFVFFRMPVGTKIVSYQIGSSSFENISLEVTVLPQSKRR